jgi:hypothetical protein
MSGALAARIRNAVPSVVATGMRRTALGAMVIGGLGLAACSGDAGNGLGGTVRMEWRTPRRVSATSDTTGNVKPSAALGGTPDTAGNAKPSATPAAKRDTVAADRRDTAGGARRDTAAGTAPSAAPVAGPTPAGPNRPGPANRPGAANNEPGRLVGSMRGRGVVVWCPGPKLAIITGVQGDTGVGLVVHPRDSLVPGAYRVLAPDSARAAAPAAAVVLRLMTRNAIEGYQGRSGALTIAEARDRHVSGQLQAEIEVVGGVQRYDFQGDLSDLPVQVGGPACPK